MMEYPTPLAPSSFVSPLVRRLKRSEAAKSVAKLHLSSRPFNALQKEKIDTIGELITAISLGSESLALGSKSVAELQGAISALVESTRADGKVDWLKYARATGVDILPNEGCEDLALSELLEMLPRQLLKAAEHVAGRTGKYVFQATVLERKPFRAVGASLGLTHQGVSLSRDRTLQPLRRALLDDDYRCCRFHFRTALVQPLRDLREMLRATGESAFTYSNWRKLIKRAWKKTDFIGAPFENLLFDILGYRLIPPVAPQREPIVLHESIEIGALRNALSQTARLMRDFPNGISNQRLRRELGRSKRASGSKVPNVRFLVDAITPAVESNGGVLRASLTDLRRMTDQAERILSDKGVPTHSKIIVMELNQATTRNGIVRSVRNLSSALSGDHRFRPIGRLGVWTLKRWHYETRSIVDVAADILGRANASMTEAELSRQMKPLRPHSYESLGSLMIKDPRFVRIKPRTWRLQKRGLNASAHRTPNASISV